jgi:hemolysin III
MKSSGQHNLITESSVIVFGIGMLLVYSFSSLYHLAQKEKTKQLLKIADHISIYYLIAGTYSPLMVIYLNKETALVFLGIMWSIVLLGTFFKIFYVDRFKFLSVLFYLLMGWMIVFVIKPLWGVIPLSIFLWILAGGLSYTVGVYFYVKGHKNYFHTVWHFFVLFGTIFHYVAILKSL